MDASPSTRFRFVGGDPALDLINTIEWTPRGPANELLADYTSLTRWAEAAGVTSPPDGQRLRGLARTHARQAAAALDRARSLRSTLQRLFLELAGGAPSSAALEAFNRFLPAIYRRLTLEAATPAERRLGRAAAWAWRGWDADLDAIVWPVMRSAAELLVSTEAEQVRVCGGHDCGWMYVDRSRNGLRRWCQMETCGTREKSRRRADRNRAP